MAAATHHISPFSGSWYPGDPADLRALLERVFAESERRIGHYAASRAVGFVVPHAGLVYSGTVAAAVYRQIRALAPERIVLLGFSHHGAERGAWMPSVSSFETPLGTVPVDREFAAALESTGRFGTLEEEQLCDHSVEIQLPLLQWALPTCRVVPIYISRLGREARRAAGRALAELITPGTVVVASSDFTHYGRAFAFQPFPADHDACDRLRELDDSVIDAAGTLDADEFLRVLQETRATVCGYDPVGLMLETVRALESREEIFQETLDYQTSGEITGDFRQSVSYAALGYFPASALDLGPDDQQALLESARRTLAHYLKTGERAPVLPERGSAALERCAAAFVTLHSRGTLRGCVGRRACSEPLSQLVPSLALAAALDDSRFDPVRPGEAELDVEISVLTPMKRILDPRQFRVNEHGALLESGLHHGLLLPQVATERNWGAAEFLEALDRKAGAHRNAHLDPDSRLYVFRAQVIR